jgi:hypothetical protein
MKKKFQQGGSLTPLSTMLDEIELVGDPRTRYEKRKTRKGDKKAMKAEKAWEKYKETGKERYLHKAIKKKKKSEKKYAWADAAREKRIMRKNRK